MVSLFGYLIKKKKSYSIYRSSAKTRYQVLLFISRGKFSLLSWAIGYSNLPPLYNRMVYVSISFVVKCLHGFYDISYDILPKPSSRRAHYLTFTHEFVRTNCLKYCCLLFICLHVLPRFGVTLPRPITDVCIDISVYPFLNTLRNFLFYMPPITQSFWFCCIKIYDAVQGYVSVV